MKLDLKTTFNLVLFCLAPLLANCELSNVEKKSIFSQAVPESEYFKKELQFLKIKKRVSNRTQEKIKKDLNQVKKKFGVPDEVLYCIFFQESRFNVLKNAQTHHLAKGLGQFTVSALDEINHDTNHYDPRTEKIINTELDPDTLPINFDFEVVSKVRHLSSIHSKDELEIDEQKEQKKTSYFNTTTAVFASGAYLNNRYRQLKLALDHQKISYDPQVLWLLAAAAYNKGSRTIFLILTHEYLARGENALSEILHDPKKTYELLTQPERLEYSLKQVWTKHTRDKYIDELRRNMEMISSCALSKEAFYE